MKLSFTKVVLPTALVAGLGMAGIVHAKTQQLETKAVFVRAIIFSAISNIDFGTYEGQTGTKSLIISPEDGSISGDMAPFQIGATNSQGSITIRGSDSQSVSIAPGTISDGVAASAALGSFGNVSCSLDAAAAVAGCNYTTTLAATATPNVGESILEVGGELTTTNTDAGGTYSGTVDIEVNYII